MFKTYEEQIPPAMPCYGTHIEQGVDVDPPKKTDGEVSKAANTQRG